MQLLPGHVIELGWNGAKHLGDEYLAYKEVRVEAAGADWVVIRTESGESRAATFSQPTSHTKILKALKE